MDSISRTEAIDVMCELMHHWFGGDPKDEIREIKRELEKLPSAQPTLYGYKIEHLAYIATVMQKEGITAEDAVRTFDDISRALRMVIEETQEKLEKSLNAMLSAQSERTSVNLQVEKLSKHQSDFTDLDA